MIALPAPADLAPIDCSAGATYRRTGCSAPAGAGGLCPAHEVRQVALRGELAAAGAPHGPPRAAHAGDPYAMLAEVVATRAAPWRARAACRGQPEVMHPEHVGSGRRPADYGPALALCATCPVAEPCRASGAPEALGVWGGTTPAQRHRGRERPVPGR